MPAPCVHKMSTDNTHPRQNFVQAAQSMQYPENTRDSRGIAQNGW